MIETIFMADHHNNESTAGADASVKMPKLHNIKLLIGPHQINLMFHRFFGSYFCRMQKKLISGPGQRSEWPHDLSKRSDVLLK